ncbi:methionine ABC transporter ATP-binding protein [Candidatus Galacturonibacter soehngenii]|uniref:ATP-binding cassette domain-containing protein n=1 Tax=Candidatus Galacturonatibacter soehngenii TaxID=2307010 RepID=A0A7V7QIK4_9FIRM|nr:ATP-binding cassette domain-containing protein [Candidatus Galacturonibacter soehngenii]KAB1436050.1 ATP-binding cassette domain-containing protein [Candidatus Galacturonibacter soehngenii]MBA4686212.1 ATP-binding cassette domain-containing protein [Candidatus Galacturonibacter soehngenii]
MIRIDNVSKVFRTSTDEIKAVNNINLTIEDGSIFGIIGLSGAGKSTLVRCINLLERPTAGRIYLNEVELTSLNPKQLRKEREKIGMIFQQFNLLEQRTALRNVCYPLEIAGVKSSEAKEKAKKLLDLVGLSDRLNNYPSQLSGGQKQRVAIARALATDPQVLLCDEATSALDPNTTRSILDLLKNINEKLGVTIVVITHEMKVVEQICDQVAVLDNGMVAETGAVKDIFLSPKSKIAQELIFPKNKGIASLQNKRILRLAFDGQSSFEPVISNLVLKCQTMVNILGASTEDIGGKAFGQMILQLPEDELAIARAKNYLDSIGIHYEESDVDGN